MTGGANWQGGAVDAENGILFIPSVTGAGILGLAPGGERSGMDYIRGQGLRLPGGEGPQGLPLLKPPWGRITAIDLNEGEILWQIPNGDTPDYVREHPALEGIDIPPTGRTERGGTLVTRTLLFAGEGGGLFAAGQGSGGNPLCQRT